MSLVLTSLSSDPIYSTCVFKVQVQVQVHVQVYFAHCLQKAKLMLLRQLQQLQ